MKYRPRHNFGRQSESWFGEPVGGPLPNSVQGLLTTTRATAPISLSERFGHKPMTHVPDLTPYTYLYSTNRAPHVNVGWLDEAFDYPRGVSDNAIYETLIEELSRPADRTRGYHRCNLCGNSEPTRIKTPIGEVVLCDAEIHVEGSGRIYVSPNLILHYMSEHSYRPPDEFQLAWCREMPERSELVEPPNVGARAYNSTIGNFLLPRNRVRDPSTRGIADPRYGEPGGRTEITTESPIDVRGLTVEGFAEEWVTR